MYEIPFEQTVARQFRLEKAPTLLARASGTKPIAFSRLRHDGMFRGATIPVPPDEAFTFQVAIGSMPEGDIWIDNRHSKLPAAAEGDTFVFNLASNPIANLKPPFDFLRFYLPVSTMNEIAYERGMRCLGGLRPTSVGKPDITMHGLALAILPAILNPAAKNALFLDSVALAFHAHVVQKYGGRLETGRALRSGLTPWQLRRVEDYIQAHLDDDPSIAALARECNLSASHFARACVRTIGMPPHRWLTKQRLERAKTLLSSGDLGLADIALLCGFADQSHFSRVFARQEGCGPGKWRRDRRH
jgi:AraC family transcriptional regulator